MTQVACFERKDFTSVPNIIYDGYAELKPLDRHVAATLLRRCYMAGWHALSMRDISELSGVPHNLMRSIEGREGILNRLQRVTENVFNFKDGATTNRNGKKCRPQTYVNVDIARLWNANTVFYAANKVATTFEEPTTEDAITVSVGYSHPTKGRRKTVSVGYSTVSPEYSTVSPEYSTVSPEYSTVSESSVNVGTKIVRIKDSKDNKDNCDCAIASSQPAINQTSSSHSYSQKPEQATLLDDSNGYWKPPVQGNIPPSKKKTSKAKNEHAPAMIVPPSMPPEDAEWSPATIRGMFNFWRGHAPLTQGTAVQQNKAASALYQANYTREQITSVYEHMCQQSYWIERGGVEIWNVANCIARELKVINKIVPFQKPGKVDVYSLSYQASRPSRLPDMYIPELDDIPQEATN